MESHVRVQCCRCYVTVGLFYSKVFQVAFRLGPWKLHGREPGLQGGEFGVGGGSGWGTPGKVLENTKTIGKPQVSWIFGCF